MQRVQPVLRNIGDNMSKKMTGRLTKEQSEVKKSIVAVIFSLFKEAGTWDDDEHRVFHSQNWEWENEEDGDARFVKWAENSLENQITHIFRELRELDILDKKRLYKAVKV